MPRPRSDIEPRIVHAARHRFLQEGVDGASLRAIARDAGTSVGMVYYYFPTKDDLFMAVVEEVYTGFVADLSTALTADGGIEHRIEQVYERIGAISDDELEVIRVLIRELLLASPRAKLALERFRAGHIPLVLSALGEGVRDGVVDGSRSPVVLLLSTFALGALPQLLIRVMGDSAPLSEAPQGEALARELASVLMRGIGTPRAPP